MPPVIATTEVGRAAADVFAYATDPARFPEWQKASPKATPTSPALPRPAPDA